MKKQLTALGFILIFGYLNTLHASDSYAKNLIIDNIPEHTFKNSTFNPDIYLPPIDEGLVDVSSHHIDDDDADALVQTLIFDPYIDILESLDIRDGLLTDSGAITLAAATYFIPQLKVLDVRNCPGITLLGMECFFIKLKNHPTATTIRFCGESYDLSTLERYAKIDCIAVDGDTKIYEGNF